MENSSLPERAYEAEAALVTCSTNRRKYGVTRLPQQQRQQHGQGVTLQRGKNEKITLEFMPNLKRWWTANCQCSFDLQWLYTDVNKLKPSSVYTLKYNATSLSGDTRAI